MHSEPDLFMTIQPEAKALLAAAVPDIVPATAVEGFLRAVEKTYGPLLPVRPLSGADIQRVCRFCLGRGCLACDAAKDAEYKRQFPRGPEPLLTFATNDPEDMHLARQALGPATLAQGAGVVLRALAEAAVTQARLQDADREDQP